MTILNPLRPWRVTARHTPGNVSTVIGMRVRACGLELAVSARFRVYSLDPAMVHLSFQPGLGKPAEADLAIPRSLLTDGLNAPAGPASETGARAWPVAGGRILVISLPSPNCTAEADAPAATVAAFLTAANRLIPVSPALASGSIGLILAESGPR